MKYLFLTVITVTGLLLNQKPVGRVFLIDGQLYYAGQYFGSTAYGVPDVAAKMIRMQKYIDNGGIAVFLGPITVDDNQITVVAAHNNGNGRGAFGKLANTINIGDIVHVVDNNGNKKHTPSKVNYLHHKTNQTVIIVRQDHHQE